MKLIHTKTNFVVLEFREKTPIFYDPILKKEMAQRGVLIPPYLVEHFGGKKWIRLQDPDFQRAFVQVYYPNYLERSSYIFC